MPDKQIVNGADITAILDEMVPIMIGKSKISVAIACLTAAITLYNPEIDAPTLKQAVEDTSNYLYHYFFPPPATSID